MPNGGVPMHMEMSCDSFRDHSYVFIQSAETLRVVYIESAETHESVEVGNVRLTTDFLKQVVDFVLGGGNPATPAHLTGAGINLVFTESALTVLKEDGTEIGRLDGDALHSFAGFAAYWVDHDGVHVSRAIPIDYRENPVGRDGTEWVFRWAF